MSDENAVAKAGVFGGNVAIKSSASLAAALRDSSDKGARGGGDFNFLNFSGKRGLYSSGVDKTRIENDEFFAVDISSFEDGWICWKGGKPVAKRSSGIGQPPVPTPDMEEHGPFNERAGEGWSQTKTFMVRSLDNDVQHQFTTSSVSGVGEVAKLLEEIALNAENGLPAWPLIFFDMEEFTAQGNTNFKPIFIVDGWLDDENVVRLAEDDVDVAALVDASGQDASPSEGEPEADEPAAPRRRRG